jgi:hypothetical protein
MSQIYRGAKETAVMSVTFCGVTLDDLFLRGAYFRLPAAVDAAACSMVVSASGAFKAFKTTPLLNAEESA